MHTDALKRKLTITAQTMARVAESYVPALEDLGWAVTVVTPSGQRFSSLDLAHASGGAEVMIIGDDEASEEFFSKVSSHLKLLVKWGVGTDSVDFVAAEKFGVEVRNTPGAFNNEVADLALAYVLALARHLLEIHVAMVDGRWSQETGTTLAGQTVGIIGFGGIGQAIATRSLAFGMKVVFVDPYFFGKPPDGCLSQSLDEVFANSDFLVLACPSTPETRGVVNGDTLKLMKSGSCLVNVSRGDLVVESDLVNFLQIGWLSGAALDVYENEPLPKSSKLRSLSNVVLGAHNGSNTYEGLLRASSIATQIVATYGLETQNG